MNIEPQYQQALDYLTNYIDYSLKGQKAIAEAEFNLDRMFDLMRLLGDPQQKYPSIHVAGSKGKGSVSVFCTSALQAQGHKVGLYTSPHLMDFRERIQINRGMIPKTDFVNLVDDIKPHLEVVPHLTRFEIETALAFWYFSRQGVDVAVIEVGLGGRLDATNVVTPKVAVITALFLEHTLILGDTMPEIAAEKGGIIKSGVPVVVSPQKEEALQVIGEIAHKNDAPLISVGHDFTFEARNVSQRKQTLIISSEQGGDEVRLQISLLGIHQIENAATAYAALQILDDQGVAISEEAIQKGFSSVEWPGRFEIFGESPLVIIDAAHTPEAAHKLRQTVETHFPNKAVVLVFGVSGDKKVQGMLSELLPITKQIIFTKSTHPRAMAVEALMDFDLPLDIPKKKVEDVQQAVDEAIQLAGDGAVVLVTGSIFVAGDARSALLKN